jgi:adenylate cyclase
VVGAGGGTIDLFQEAIKPTDEAKREFIFLALLRYHPTLSWIALGFPDGAFFGALKAGDDEIDMVEVKRDPQTGIRQQRVDTYTLELRDKSLESATTVQSA